MVLCGIVGVGAAVAEPVAGSEGVTLRYSLTGGLFSFL